MRSHTVLSVLPKFFPCVLLGIAVITPVAVIGGCREKVEEKPAANQEQARQDHIERLQRESGKGAQAPQY